MSKLNSEFNYRYQVIGETPWAKIQTLHGFLDGRVRAAALEKVSEMKYKAKLMEIEHLRAINALPHVILTAEAELLETESYKEEEAINFALNRDEIACIRKLLDECYAIVEPTRLKHPDGTPYTDEEMYEVNAANEFTTVVGREIHSEIIANGRPSPAKLLNAMSNPHTFAALKLCGLIPKEAQLLEGSNDPLRIGLKEVEIGLVTQEYNPQIGETKQENA
jgi:hypothetical protein